MSVSESSLLGLFHYVRYSLFHITIVLFFIYLPFLGLSDINLSFPNIIKVGKTVNYAQLLPLLRLARTYYMCPLLSTGSRQLAPAGAAASVLRGGGGQPQGVSLGPLSRPQPAGYEVPQFY